MNKLLSAVAIFGLLASCEPTGTSPATGTYTPASAPSSSCANRAIHAFKNNGALYNADGYGSVYAIETRDQCYWGIGDNYTSQSQADNAAYSACLEHGASTCYKVYEYFPIYN